MRANAHVVRLDRVLPAREARGEVRARRDEDLRQQDRLRPERLAARERHEVVDDRVGQPRVPLDLVDMRPGGDGVAPVDLLPGDVRAAGDDLQHVAQFVSHLGRNFTDEDEPLARLVLIVVLHGAGG